MEKIFDSHAHYDDDAFDEDRDSVLSSLQTSVCNILNAASDIDSAEKSLKLAENYDYIYAAVGIHPHSAAQSPDDFIQILKGLARHEKVVAIGEIGLDYHYDFSPRDIQMSVFIKQIKLANELDLPVIIHDRESHEDMYNILRQEKPKSGVIHCFSGSAELAHEAIQLGLHIGIGGAVTFKNNKKAARVVENMPLERLLLETDAPYMSPVPFRGKRCQSDMIVHAAMKIAEIKGKTTDEIIRIARDNAKALFNVD